MCTVSLIALEQLFESCKPGGSIQDGCLRLLNHECHKINNFLTADSPDPDAIYYRVQVKH